MRKSVAKRDVVTSATKPIDIPLAEGVFLDGNAVFVRLPTYQTLKNFWEKHCAALPYSAEGVSGILGEKEYLHEYEWVFGPTKAAVVKAVMRWDQLGVDCEWYDWAGRDPQARALFFPGTF